MADMAFNPFNASHLATAANDGAPFIASFPSISPFFRSDQLISLDASGILRVFEIPAGAASGKAASDALTTIQASPKRLLSVDYHPMAGTSLCKFS